MRAYLEDVITGRRNGFAAACVRGALTLPEFAYRAVSSYVRWSYLSGRKKRERLPCVAISVGNISSGGTGKTPLVQWIARWLQREQVKVAIVATGYGGTLRETGAVVSDEQSIFLNVEQASDEAVLHARSLPGVPVLIGRDRVRMGMRAVQEFGAQVVLLDDGYQYWRLERDLNIAVVDGQRPFDNGHVLPRGLLREPPETLQRADLVVVNKAHRLDDAQQAKLKTELSRYLSPETPLVFTAYQPVSLYELRTGEQRPVEWLRGKRIYALSALADNESFHQLLQRQQTILTGVRCHTDHHRYTQDDIREAAAEARAAQAECIVITEKDAVKIDPRWTEFPVWVLRVEMCIVEGEEALTRRLQAPIATKLHFVASDCGS